MQRATQMQREEVSRPKRPILDVIGTESPDPLDGWMQQRAAWHFKFAVWFSAPFKQTQQLHGRNMQENTVIFMAWNSEAPRTGRSAASTGRKAWAIGRVRKTVQPSNAAPDMSLLKEVLQPKLIDSDGSRDPPEQLGKRLLNLPGAHVGEQRTSTVLKLGDKSSLKHRTILHT